MNIFLVSTIFSSIAAVIWLFFIYRLDEYEKEPFGLIVKVFLGGIVFSFVALFLNTVVEKSFGLGYGLITVGFIEEAVKIVPVLLIAYKSRYFNEPMDGLFYAGVASLGFGFMENIIYNQNIITHFQDKSLSFLLFRGTIPFVHVLLASFWGYALGLYKQKVYDGKKLFFAYLLSSVIHSSYDLLVTFSTIFSFVIIILLVLFTHRIKYLNRISPLNDKYLIECKKCSKKILSNSIFCQNCGYKITYLSNYKIFCKNCQKQVMRKWRFCQSCGVKMG